MLLRFLKRLRRAWHSLWNPVETVVLDGTIMTIHADAEYHDCDDSMHIDILMIINHEVLKVHIAISMPEYRYFQEHPESFREMLIYRLTSGFKTQVFEKLLKTADIRKLLKLEAVDGRKY